MRSNLSEQPNTKNMRNENNNNNEGSGNSSTITTTSTKRGKNKSSGGGSSNINNNNNNTEKTKQPQRGLGVAQLEKIRLHSQMASVGILPHQIPPPPHPAAFLNPPPFQHVPDEMRYQVGYQVTAPPPPPFCCSSPPVSSSSFGFHHPNAFMIGMGDQMERTANIRYTESQPFNTPRWNPSTSYRAMPETQPYTEPPGMVTRHLLSHVEQHNGRSNMFEPMSSSFQHYDPSENQEVDLELRL